jgi:hypothetical protein
MQTSSETEDVEEEKLPAGQGSWTEDPAVQKYPAEQLKQTADDVAPAEAEYVPAAHGVGFDIPAVLQ